MNSWVTVGVALVAVGGASLAPAEIILDQVNASNEYRVDTGLTASTVWRAQTFTTGISGQLSRIDLDIYLRQFASGSILLDLLSTNAGVPTSTVLAATSLPSSSVPPHISQHGFVSFDLTAMNIHVTEGEVLAIALRSSNDQLIGGWVGGHTNYAGGQFYYNYPTNNNGWVVFSPPDEYDLYFKTYVDVAAVNSVPEPGTAVGLAGLGSVGLIAAWRKRKRTAA